MTVGENIKTLREHRGMSQSELARRIDVTRASVCQWEKGAVRPKMDKVESMAGVFGVPCSTIIGGEFHYAVVDGVPELELQRLIAAFSSMDDDMRQAALSVIEYMADVK